MNYFYLDASAWVKRYHREEGTEWVQDLVSGIEPVICSIYGFLELWATLIRKSKTSKSAKLSLDTNLAELERDWNHFVKINLDSDTVSWSKDITYKYALRAGDALHLASALRFQSQLDSQTDRLIMVTCDQELLNASISSHLAVFNPAIEKP